MKKVIIFGITNFSEVAFYNIDSDDRYEVVAFCIDKEYKTKDTHMGKKVLEFESIEKHYSPAEYEMVIAIGYNGLNSIREKKFNEAKEKGYTMTTFISKHSSIASNTKIGEGCLIFENNTIHPFVEIGYNNIIWSGNHISHHSKIGNNNFFSLRVSFAGNTKMGNNNFIGINSIIRDEITIESNCLIGAGSIILKDLPENSVVAVKSSEVSKVPSYKIKNI